MSIGIYKIENLINHKVYIGQSIEIERRWQKHLGAKDDFVIHRALRKYGKENFSFSAGAFVLLCFSESFASYSISTMALLAWLSILTGIKALYSSNSTWFRVNTVSPSFASCFTTCSFPVGFFDASSKISSLSYRQLQELSLIHI